MPAAPTAFSLTPGPQGSPDLTLAWDHSGVDLYGFEVLFREDGNTDWKTYKLGPAADFGAGPYQLLLSSSEETDWVVRAISPTGTVST